MTQTLYIIYSYRDGYQFVPKDGDTMTAEQVAHYRSFDNEADAIAEVTRQYKVQLEGGFACGGSDNCSYFDAELIAQFTAEQIEGGETPNYTWYTVPGYYENGVLECSDAELAAGIGSYRSDVTTTTIIRVEVPEAESDFYDEEDEEELAA